MVENAHRPLIAASEVVQNAFSDARDETATWDPASSSQIPPILHAAQFVRSPARFDDYVVNEGHIAVIGWVLPGALSAVTAFNGLQRRLNVKGHVCEIGVHHGRFFIALSLMRMLGERSLAIDVFDMQEFNVDKSGLGDLQSFMLNVDNWLAPPRDIIVHKADSLQVRGAEVISLLDGPVRFFSVDGSHTCDHTLNDIRIAEESLAAGGLVIVDDFLNPAWPGVLEAIVRYLDEPDRPSKLGRRLINP